MESSLPESIHGIGSYRSDVTFIDTNQESSLHHGRNIESCNESTVISAPKGSTGKVSLDSVDQADSVGPVDPVDPIHLYRLKNEYQSALNTADDRQPKQNEVISQVVLRNASQPLHPLGPPLETLTNNHNPHNPHNSHNPHTHNQGDNQQDSLSAGQSEPLSNALNHTITPLSKNPELYLGSSNTAAAPSSPDGLHDTPQTYDLITTVTGTSPVGATFLATNNNGSDPLIPTNGYRERTESYLNTDCRVSSSLVSTDSHTIVTDNPIHVLDSEMKRSLKSVPVSSGLHLDSSVTLNDREESKRGLQTLSVGVSYKRRRYSTSSKKGLPRWNDMLFQLLLYRTEHGNCMVPLKSGGELGKWVANQRAQYISFQKHSDLKFPADSVIEYTNEPPYQGDPSNGNEDPNLTVNGLNESTDNSETLTMDRMKVLSSVGFVWDVVQADNDARWKKRYEELVQYKSYHGHCNVPQSSELGKWVKMQRENKHETDLKKAGKTPARKKPKPCLSEERISKLEAIGFQWRVAQPAVGWDKRFQQLIEYKALNGDCNVPQSYPPDKPFGRWVMKQRCQQSLKLRGVKSQLTDEREAKLTAIGFSWVAPGFSKKTVSLPDPDDDSDDDEMDDTIMLGGTRNRHSNVSLDSGHHVHLDAQQNSNMENQHSSLSDQQLESQILVQVVYPQQQEAMYAVDNSASQTQNHTEQGMHHTNQQQNMKLEEMHHQNQIHNQHQIHHQHQMLHQHQSHQHHDFHQHHEGDLPSKHDVRTQDLQQLNMQFDPRGMSHERRVSREDQSSLDSGAAESLDISNKIVDGTLPPNYTSYTI